MKERTYNANLPHTLKVLGQDIKELTFRELTAQEALQAGQDLTGAVRGDLGQSMSYLQVSAGMSRAQVNNLTEGQAYILTMAVSEAKAFFMGASE